MQAISSPKQNVAQRAVVLVQTATTKIKEVITNGLMEGKSQEELTKTLNGLIDTYCRQLENVELREEARQALVRSCRKWFYQLEQTIKILNRNLASQVSGFKGDTFTGDIVALLRDVDKMRINAIRPHLDQSRKGLAVISDYDKMLKVALKALAAEPPKIVKVAETDKRRGYTYTMSLRNRAEMTVRYESNLVDLQKFIDAGVEYVWTTSHPDASPRCAPHQGKLYSINADNKQGMHNGIPYTYLPDVLKLNEGNSIINGYNCRHRLVAYQDGSHPPTEYTKEEIKREYAIDQKQRYYENNIRQLKTEERLMREAGYLNEAKKLRRRWRRLNKEYEIFSLENQRAFYRWRTIVSKDEEYYTPEIDEKPLKKSAEYGIISIDTDAYTDERKASAYKFERRVEADALLRPQTEKLWSKMSTEEKKAIYNYTVDSFYLNKTARSGKTNDDIDAIESVIKKAPLENDMWLKRVSSMSGLSKHLGIPLDEMRQLTPAQLKKRFSGKEVLDNGFVSTSISGDCEYMPSDPMEVRYRIYAPKGTRAVYCEPFSAFNFNTGNKGLNWDGKSKPTHSDGSIKIAYEAELLINRGYYFRIKNIEKKGNRLVITEEVVEREKE